MIFFFFQVFFIRIRNTAFTYLLILMAMTDPQALAIVLILSKFTEAGRFCTNTCNSINHFNDKKAESRRAKS
jgi:hypothetical protein